MRRTPCLCLIWSVAVGLGAAGFGTLGFLGDNVGLADARDGAHGGSAPPGRVLRPSPTARFVFTPAAPEVGQSVRFDGSSSSGGGHSIVSFSWNFGDNRTGSGRSVTHAYAAPGAYTVNLTVRNSKGGANSFTQIVFVSLPPNQPPTASFVISANPAAVNQVVTFDASASTDPDGSPLSYTWTFADGTTQSSSAPTVQHIYAVSGSYLVTLEVTDNRGGTHTRAQIITILTTPLPSDQPPVGSANLPVQAVGTPPPTVTAPVTAPRTRRLMSPFPIVRLRGRVTARGTVVQLLIVYAPQRTHVDAYCEGRGCPRKRQRVTVRHDKVRLRAFEQKFRAGVRITIYATQDGRIGKYTRFTIRKVKPPARRDRCATGRTAIPCPRPNYRKSGIDPVRAPRSVWGEAR